MIKIKKVFFAWQMDKEQAWLEDMAKQGYVLKAIKPFRYYFEKGDPVDLVYQFDFQFMSKKNEPEYLEIFKEWTLASKLGGWYYFYKERIDDEKDSIFSDNDSKSGLFKRIIGFLALVAFPLYYQVLIVFPNMDPDKFSYPNFYFFLRIIVLVFLALHLLVCLRILNVIIAYKKRITE